MYNEEYYTSEELYHYGVLGMKWGVRRGHADKAYAKASNKLDRIDKKTKKYQAKVEKNIRKLATYSRPDGSKAKKANARVDKYTSKSLKSMRKAEKWYKKMEKTFAKTPISMSDKQIEIGKQYMNVMNERSRKMMVDRVYR